ncbi:23S rRNA (adenine(1618)-N(6))-methyltransferase RlmF [Mucilaginibacter sp. RB4R14]|uniref:23S rRNA (adenine(1618)-N(6))-methyltransferase RlmF n=1 Tax=Mucilaginibacter aurantiaciroseus TaxID=2949308 RepID=UPI002090504A|nr:23S rRNA (adenine(1618)-N(6))-methyltransferase RlmF [Mucilaginibacter aurantiaciroseus]MCO5936928.1 23S rRNA (adenine(1618)-N(6))-methyltransferase RlmF [Mucilaginibacter aurantiaciroseus]
MADKQNAASEEKTILHPRNAHRSRYDFQALIKALPALRNFVSQNDHDELTIDFTDPEAVKTLNQALLKKQYGINIWDIPEGFLCPPIPGRADYIHYIADVLAEVNKGEVPTGSSIKVLDIGVGANCIYPLIGHKTYGWNFVGSEADYIALASAKKIVEDNGLTGVIDIRKQTTYANIFDGVIKPGEKFDITMCNPPFHSSSKEVKEKSTRKWKNLGQDKGAELNFGGRNNELWYEGGEPRFLNKMITESKQYAKSCKWFSSLISKKTTLDGCYKSLDYYKAADVKTISMSQGQKTSRILAWRF